ncbi:MAG: phosphate ABC transporter permease subunit PstC [Phototrophicaceae bacterium]
MTTVPKPPAAPKAYYGVGDQRFLWVVQACAAVAVIVILAILLVLVTQSQLALSTYGFGIITGTLWDLPAQRFGALSFVYGTVVSSLIALTLAAPVAVGTAIYVSEYAPAWLGRPIAFVVELLVAIPSVVYGLWGTAALVIFMREVVNPALIAVTTNVPFLGNVLLRPPDSGGRNLLTSGVILAIMILPIIMSVSREIIAQVPRLHKEGMLALGATKWEVIRLTVLPYARSGVIGAALLGLARALGETMAVLMIGGGGITFEGRIEVSLFSTVSTIASRIASSATESVVPIEFSALVALGLVLMGVSSIVNIIARELVRRTSLTGGGI